MGSFDATLELLQQTADLRIEPKQVDMRSRGLLRDDDPGYNCSHMSSWRWWTNGTIYVPGHGHLIPTGHAKSQIGSRLGIRYSKFLGPMKEDPELIQQALQPHVNARREDPALTVKVVAQKFEGSPPIGVDGILRGVVGPRYAEIHDIRVLEALRRVAGKELDEMNITSARHTDAATYLNLVYPEVKDLLPSVGDEVLSGFKLWNSEVGGRALGAAEFLHRLVCANGMVINVEGDQLLNRRHHSITEEELERLLREMWEKLPNRFDRLVASATRLERIPIVNAEAEIERFLRSQAQPKYVREAVKEAFKLEPLNSAYGILQAITRVSTAAHTDPDRQLDFEHLGGEYLLQMTQEQAQA